MFGAAIRKLKAPPLCGAFLLEQDMPGTRLSKAEKDAQNWWENENSKNLLKSISIESNSPTGLRGITSLEVIFKAPVTVISGRNGSGKSTVLALSVLGFHGDGTRAPRIAKNGKHYTFNDFFFKGPSDPKLNGITIKWNYKGSADELEIEKNTSKWMHYERRPKNHSEHIGISRCVPAFEQNVLKQHFSSSSPTTKGSPLSEKWRKRLSLITGMNYVSAEEKSSKKYKIRECSTTNSYSSFNMGAGEDIAFELLSIIYSAPDYSIIAIEELETGLHPSAQKKFAQMLPEIALEKKCQIIITSHSEHIIDNLPRESRVLLSRTGKSHIPHYSVSTRYALGELSESAQPELKIFCEDPLCKQLIQNTLPSELRKAVSIIAAGSDSELLNHAWAHTISGEKHKTLVIWDGEVTFKKIKTWYNTVNSKNETYNYKHKTQNKANIGILKLPGSTPPEPWIIEKIESTPEAIEKIKDRFQLPYSSSVNDIIEAAKLRTDHHSLFYTFQEHLQIPETEVQAYITQLISELFRNDLSSITDYVKSLINK